MRTGPGTRHDHALVCCSPQMYEGKVLAFIAVRRLSKGTSISPLLLPPSLPSSLPPPPPHPTPHPLHDTHRCETGNGLAFQFFFCWAVWLVGLGVGAYRGFPSTPPLALLGGALWCTGNLLSVPAIKLIGLGLSLLIWGISNMCVGWASSTFGILGVQTQHVAKPALNYSGAAVAVLALLVYLFVKPTQALPAAGGPASSSLLSFKRGSSGLYAGRASPSLQSFLLVEEEEEEEEEGLHRPGSRGGRAAAGGDDAGRDEHGGQNERRSIL